MALAQAYEDDLTASSLLIKVLYQRTTPDIRRIAANKLAGNKSFQQQVIHELNKAVRDISMVHRISVAALDELAGCGLDLNCEDGERQTFLMTAAMHADAALLDIALEAGAAINQTNSVHFTSLMRAVMNGKKDNVVHLLEKGADPNIAVPPDNHTALTWAMTQENTEIVVILMQYGARPWAKNTRGDNRLGCIAIIETEEQLLAIQASGIPLTVVDTAGFSVEVVKPKERYPISFDNRKTVAANRTQSLLANLRESQAKEHQP